MQGAGIAVSGSYELTIKIYPGAAISALTRFNDALLWAKFTLDTVHFFLRYLSYDKYKPACGLCNRKRKNSVSTIIYNFSLDMTFSAVS